MHVGMHVCMHAHMHVCTYVPMYVCGYVPLQVCMYVCMYVGVCVCVRVCSRGICIRMWARACVFVYMWACVCVSYVYVSAPVYEDVYAHVIEIHRPGQPISLKFPKDQVYLTVNCRMET